MRRSKSNDLKNYDLSNCFGFDENDLDLSFLDNSSVMNSTNASLQFQPDKPYRLALYVKPSERRRCNITNISNIVKNNVEKQTKSKKNQNNVTFKLADKSEIKKGRKNTMLFDENIKPENTSKKLRKTPEKEKVEKDVTKEIPSVRKNVLKEVNTKPVTKTKQNKIRKSYERKCKEKDTEIIPEPPSDKILKELDLKKITKTKLKKTTKEEQEFEKWANSMNSVFNDVDKFELSITYD